MSERIAPNFLRSEFACPCCGLDRIDPEVVAICQDVREFFDRPVIITSGCRCEAHNEEVGGAKNSLHLEQDDCLCHAADIVVQGIPASIVQELLESWDVPGLGAYDDYTHLDTRDGFARW